MNKHIDISAATQEEALQKAAQQLQCDISNVRISKIQKTKSGNVYRINMLSEKEQEEKVDSILNTLENTIQGLDTNNLISEVLQEGDSVLSSAQSDDSLEAHKIRKRTEEPFIFSENIDYYVCEIYEDINAIPFEEIEYLTPCKKGDRIATQKWIFEYANEKLFNPSLVYSKEYLQSNNLDIAYKKGYVHFNAQIPGRAILLKKRLYLIPSDHDATCEIWVTQDKLQALATISPPKGNGKPLNLGEILEKLKSMAIVYGIQDTTIQRALNATQESGEKEENVVVAQGDPAIDGRDAVVEYLFSLEPQDGLCIMPDGRVDYHKKQPIELVKKDALIAKIKNHREGVDGKSVYGTVLKARKAEENVLHAGANVTADSSGKRFFAQINGQPVLNKNILNVYPHYNVPSDVDYSIGNIEFDGNVTVSGNVLPGFEIKATGDVVVLKNVDGALIEAGRDVKVAGAIIGGENTTIKVGRNLTAHHIQNAVVEVEGDVIVFDSVLHSTISALGTVVVREKKGTIVGGKIQTLRSIEAKTIGSRTGTKTEIIAGKDFLTEKKRQELKKVIEFCNTTLKKIELYLKPLLEQLKQNKKLAANKTANLKQIANKHKELQKVRSISQAKLQNLKSAQGKYDSVIKIKDTIYPDVKISIKDSVSYIREKITHTQLYLDKKTQEICKKNF